MHIRNTTVVEYVLTDMRHLGYRCNGSTVHKYRAIKKTSTGKVVLNT